MSASYDGQVRLRQLVSHSSNVGEGFHPSKAMVETSWTSRRASFDRIAYTPFRPFALSPFRPSALPPFRPSPALGYRLFAICYLLSPFSR